MNNTVDLFLNAPVTPSKFNKRSLKGNELQEWFIQYLKNNKIDFFHSGIEFICNKNILDKLRKYTCKGSNLMRFQPDLVVLLKQNPLWFEIKNSSGIEQSCFYYYLELQEFYKTTIVFVLKNKKLCELNDLKFKIMPEYDEISQMFIPVEDKIWRCPNMLKDDEREKYLIAYNGKTSGNTFAYIDFDTSKMYDVSILNKYK